MDETTSDNLIVDWTEEFSNWIAPYQERQVLEPESMYPGWSNFVSQKSIRAIAISPISRQIWMATWGGVLSWRQRDESTYYRYSSEHGLAGNGVSCICIDSEERPWVGHEEGGLGYFENNRWHVYRERKKEIFRVVARAYSGTGIWAAATSNCIYRISGPAAAALPFLVDEPSAEHTLALIDAGEYLLVGNHQGLLRVDHAGQVEKIAPDTIKSCVSLTRDVRGHVWIATANAVYRMSAGQVDVEPVYENSDVYVCHTDAGRDSVWVLTTAGLGLIQNDEWKSISPKSTSSDGATLATIAVSSDDRHLWIGTNSLLSSVYYDGDGSATLEHSQLPRHKEDELHNLARCIAGSETGDPTVWVGTANGLVSFRADDTWTLEHQGNDIRDICVTSDGDKQTVWLLEWPKGINALNFNHKSPPGIPISLTNGVEGEAYGLTSRGLWFLGPRNKEVAGVPAARTYMVAQTQDQVWWAGTAEGLFRLVHGNWSSVKEQPGPGLAEVYALLPVGKKMWVAAANGLWCWNNKVWESHNGPETRIVRALGVAGDAKKLWLAQQDGVVRYAPQYRKADRSYSLEEHGFSSLRVNAIAEIRGDLWIATAAGISRLCLSDEVIE
jgi:ligand-binding sensor domain-containing protein